MARAERRLTWAGWTTRQLPGGLCRPKGQVRCDPAMGLQTDPEATQRPMRDRASGSTDGNGLLEPYEGKPSRTVLRGGGGGDAASLPDTAKMTRVFPRLLAEPAGVPFRRASPGRHLPALFFRMILPIKLATFRPLAELPYGERGTALKSRHGNGKRQRLPSSPGAGDGRGNAG